MPRRPWRPALLPAPLLPALLLAMAGPASALAIQDPAPKPGAAAEDPRFAPRLEFHDGDTVVLVGDGFLERDHEFGYLETELTSLWPERNVKFRNLGWTGDSVWGDSRAGFETAKEGFERRRDLVLALKPNVIVVSCGMNESFAGEAGLPKFVDGLKAMLDSFAPAKARVVLISPIVHETLPPPLPNPAEHNRVLGLYRQAMAEVAAERKHLFIDLARRRIGDGTRPERVVKFPETIDGIHLNAFGAWGAATAVAEELKPLSLPSWTGMIAAPKGADRPAPRLMTFNQAPITDLEATPKGLKFVSTDSRLPDLGPPAGTPPALATELRRLGVVDLKPGRYALLVDGQPVVTATADQWAKGIDLRDFPERRQAEALRQAILTKNRLLFYRWRPQNETYLFGFRKHEQGNNAAEIPQFDPLVAEQEAEIARLRKPVPHTYELIRQEDAR